MNKTFCIIVLVMAAAAIGIAQRPPRAPQGRPGVPPQARDARPPQPGRDPQVGDWTRPHDIDKNGIVDSAEFAAAADRTFKELDRDGSGSIEADEAIRPPRPNQAGPITSRPAPGAGEAGILPPFFFLDRVNEETTISRAEFDQIVKAVFAEMDGDGDGSLTGIESKRMPPRPDRPQRRPDPPPMPPNARFIGAELRFGDKLVKGQPFSAEIVIEDTKRLFDGSTVVKQARGAIYRDTAGRTRREQPLDMVGGFSIVGKDDKPQKLIFISDPAGGFQIFLDLQNRSARKSPLRSGTEPFRPDARNGASEESLGTRSIEGISVEGTRTTFQIPAGDIGNDQPLQVVTERWFSKDLDAIVFSKHVDPIAGEHVYKLVNIRRSEPSSSLFKIPAGFRLEPPARRQ